MGITQNALKPNKYIVKRDKKRITSSQVDRMITRISKKYTFMTAFAIIKELNLHVNTPAVQRRLVESGLHGRISQIVPTLSAKNIKDCLNFACQYVSW